MKKTISFLLVILLCISFCVFSNACNGISGSDNKNDKPEKPSIDTLELSEYVKLGDYKGLTVTETEYDDRHRGDAIWDVVFENSEIIAYPEGLAEYYEEQEKEQYRRMAYSNMSYEDILEFFNTSEEEIAKNSKRRAKEDLVIAAIAKAEGIVLTEENIDQLFDSYVAKYAEIGYTEEYVRANLYDEIIDTMLFDKTIEFLIINNHFE